MMYVQLCIVQLQMYIDYQCIRNMKINVNYIPFIYSLNDRIIIIHCLAKYGMLWRYAMYKKNMGTQ